MVEQVENPIPPEKLQTEKDLNMAMPQIGEDALQGILSQTDLDRERATAMGIDRLSDPSGKHLEDGSLKTMTVVNKGDPFVFASLYTQSDYLYSKKHDSSVNGKPALANFCNYYLNLSISVNGRGRKDVREVAGLNNLNDKVNNITKALGLPVR